MARRRKRRAGGFLTGLVLLLLIFGVGVQLYRMQDRLRTAREEEEALAAQIAQLEEANQELQEDIDHAGDPEMIEQIAREELGMAVKDEKVFYHSGG